MDMIMVYKIAQGFSGCTFQKFFSMNNYMSTRNNGFTNSKCEENFFTQRMINDWNGLQEM